MLIYMESTDRAGRDDRQGESSWSSKAFMDYHGCPDLELWSAQTREDGQERACVSRGGEQVGGDEKGPSRIGPPDPPPHRR